MPRRSSVLCPIDFSAASLDALRYAAAVTEQREGSLTVMTVEDPLLAAMEAPAGQVWQDTERRRELSRVVEEVLGARATALDVQVAVEVGRPWEEILRLARERSVDLIVMSSHGLTGMRKMFFGSTTERVLRESPAPVLVTRPGDHVPRSPRDVRELANRVLVPVDLDPTAAHTVHVAAAMARQLAVPLLITHVVEPTRVPFPRRAQGLRLDRERRADADEALERLAAANSQEVLVETLVAYGDPAEEIAKIARDRHAGLIGMPLRAGAAAGVKVGSVAYRVVCLTPSMVLALPGSGTAQGEGQLGLSSAALAPG
jgi:nucleotide-binding universal stress UspA family protein